MDDHGKFNMDILDLLNSDDDLYDEYLATISIDDLVPVDNQNASSMGLNNAVLRDILTKNDDDEMPPPEMPTLATKMKRFKTVTEKEIDELFSARESKSTKKNTAWGLRTFQDWSFETTGRYVDMDNIQPTELATKLENFYCGARPKDGEVYHKNSLISIRAAINRHLANLRRDIDIVRDKQFKHCNGVLDGLLKQRVLQGLSKPTKHKEILEADDVNKIATYLSDAKSSPIILRHAVWYFLSIHFVTRGMEFHVQLKPDSFQFLSDEHGEYACLKHETQQKNFQGGLLAKENDHTQKRMYASSNGNTNTGNSNCPVEMLKFLIEKTDKGATHLFNQYQKDALSNPARAHTWFSSKPLSKRTFSRFLPEICKAAGVTKSYTPHCLRATSIQFLNDKGFEARHIMHMSNHRCESSLRSYNRSVSSTQKKNLSNALSTLTNPRVLGNELVPCGNLDQEITTTTNSTMNCSIPVSHNVVVGASNQQSNTLTPGFFSNSSFSGCVFNIRQSGVKL